VFKLNKRVVVTIMALSLAGLIYTQIPQSGSVALAGNGYPSPTPTAGAPRIFKKKATPTP
jgi:hypothetical protein